MSIKVSRRIRIAVMAAALSAVVSPMVLTPVFAQTYSPATTPDSTDPASSESSDKGRRWVQYGIISGLSAFGYAYFQSRGNAGGGSAGTSDRRQSALVPSTMGSANRTAPSNLSGRPNGDGGTSITSTPNGTTVFSGGIGVIGGGTENSQNTEPRNSVSSAPLPGNSLGGEALPLVTGAVSEGSAAPGVGTLFASGTSPIPGFSDAPIAADGDAVSALSIGSAPEPGFVEFAVVSAVCLAGMAALGKRNRRRTA